ncbi:hypothetical protein [Porphyromonas crevioricanis]|nr:hypothetical protein [Porphyromonas crevioricanis]
MKQPELDTYLSRLLEDYLAANGLNHTSERFEILRAVLTLDKEVEPFSARTVYERHRDLGGQAGRNCIYDTLMLLERAAIVVRVPVLVGSGIGYLLGYHFSNSIAHLCLYCNKIHLYKRSRFLNTLSVIHPKGCVVGSNSVFLYGICAQCSSKKRRLSHTRNKNNKQRSIGPVSQKDKK